MGVCIRVTCGLNRFAFGCMHRSRRVENLLKHLATRSKNNKNKPDAPIAPTPRPCNPKPFNLNSTPDAPKPPPLNSYAKKQPNPEQKKKEESQVVLLSALVAGLGHGQWRWFRGGAPVRRCGLGCRGLGSRASGDTADDINPEGP